MGLPMVLLAVAVGGQVVGGFQKAAADKAQAAAQQQQYNAQAQAQNYQAQIAENNAATAQQNARVAAAAGEQQAFDKELATKKAVGATLAEQGASGIDINSGSAPDVVAGTRETGMLDALTVRSNAAREAYGYQVQGSNFEAQSEADKAAVANDIIAGANAKTAGSIAAGGDILSGLTGAATTAGNSKALF